MQQHFTCNCCCIKAAAAALTRRSCSSSSSSSSDSRSGAPELEPVFTDPLRRQTWPGDDSSDEQVAAGDEEGAGTDDQLQHPVVTTLRLPPLWLQGLKLYDR